MSFPLPPSPSPSPSLPPEEEEFNLGDVYLAACRAAAESDARLYRSAAQSFARIRAILAEGEANGVI